MNFSVRDTQITLLASASILMCSFALLAAQSFLQHSSMPASMTVSGAEPSLLATSANADSAQSQRYWSKRETITQEVRARLDVVTDRPQRQLAAREFITAGFILVHLDGSLELNTQDKLSSYQGNQKTDKARNGFKTSGHGDAGQTDLGIGNPQQVQRATDNSHYI